MESTDEGKQVGQRMTDQIHIVPQNLPPAQNLDGAKGGKCNNCGGFGYTMGLKGVTLNCTFCQGTGARQVSPAELEARLSAVEQDLAMLRQAILSTVEAGELPKSNFKETIHE